MNIPTVTECWNHHCRHGNREVQFQGTRIPAVLAFLQMVLLLRFTLDIFPWVECRIHHNREFSPKIQCRVIWISKVLQSLTRRESRDFFPHVTYGMQGTLHHGWQPQSTMSDDPYLIGPGLSTHTHSTVNLESLLPHETLRSPQYGFHSQSASPSYPHLQFSGPVTSSVTQPPVIPGYSYPYGNCMRAQQQATHSQSASSGDLHISGPVTSSFTHPPVIPVYTYPYGNPMRVPLQTPQLQSTSSDDPYLSSPMSSVIHRPVIPGYSSYPYGNYMGAPLLAPQPQSASPGDSYISSPVTSSVTHRPVIPGFLSPRGILSSPPSGMQRGSPEVQHERNPSTESDTRPSQ